MDTYARPICISWEITRNILGAGGYVNYNLLRKLRKSSKISLDMDLRKAFVNFFASKRHLEIPRHSVLSQQDPTLLFINSGMAAMKEYFTGAVKPPSSRIVTCQPCLRVGGKHNDLEEVGRTTRHHTLFEMLGNFSFGDYGREEAISLAWEFITQHLNVTASKLWVTVHPEDARSRAVWEGVCIDRARILDVSENRWSAGDVGPRGYCTEIFYDFGPQYAGERPDHGDTGERYIEIWNIVLMEECVQPDGSISPLPAPCVDTGMGLERMEAVLQGSYDSYQSSVIQQLRNLARKSESVSARILADHARAIVFLVADNIHPGPTGRGYVLRRIMRRALRHQIELGEEGLLAEMAIKTIELMSGHYTHLADIRHLVSNIIEEELKKFQSGWEHGSALLQEAIHNLNDKILPGKLAFTLYDTHGFPLDLTESICRDQGIQIDHKGFECEMEKQRKRSAWSRSDKIMYTGINNLAKTNFVGYDTTNASATIIQLYSADGTPIDQLNGNGWIVLDTTPFYAESGGQAPDKGYIDNAQVSDVQKLDGVWVHKVAGVFQVMQSVRCSVDRGRRATLRMHHSATHLLCAALKKYHPEVTFHGSCVEVDSLRLDFSYPHTVTQEFLRKIEQTINDWIGEDIPCSVQHMSFKDAIDAGSATLPNKQYPSIVRVVRFGDYDIQLCGGTHINSTAELGGFRIENAGSVGSGVKRISAKAGLALAQYMEQQYARLERIAQLLNTKPSDIERKISTLIDIEKPAEQWESQVYKSGGLCVVYASGVISVSSATKHIDKLMSEHSADAVVFNAIHDKGSIVICKSNSQAHNAKQASQTIADSARGGGTDKFAQAANTRHGDEMIKSQTLGFFGVTAK
jgi:alanyl-tRNA synthetase